MSIIDLSCLCVFFYVIQQTIFSFLQMSKQKLREDMLHLKSQGGGSQDLHPGLPVFIACSFYCDMVPQ